MLLDFFHVDSSFNCKYFMCNKKSTFARLPDISFCLRSCWPLVSSVWHVKVCQKICCVFICDLMYLLTFTHVSSRKFSDLMCLYTVNGLEFCSVLYLLLALHSLYSHCLHVYFCFVVASVKSLLVAALLVVLIELTASIWLFTF